MRVPLTSPLGFQRYLQSTVQDIEWGGLPLLMVLAIALLIALLDKPFFLQPGISIQLPSVPATGLTSVTPLSVLTVKSNNTLILEGHVYTLAGLSNGLYKLLQKHETEAPVLLVKVDQNTDMGAILTICETAKRAGFSKVQIAATELQSAEGTWIHAL